jgi:ABC-type transporter Mla subunit MlaD
MISRNGRVAAVSIVTVAVIAAAIAAIPWRSQTARRFRVAAVHAISDSRVTVRLTATFWHEREAMSEYMFTPSPVAWQEVGSLHTSFQATSAAPQTSVTDAEERSRRQARAAEAGLYGDFLGLRSVAVTTPADEVAAATRLSARELSVLGPLNTLDQLQIRRVAVTQAAANAAAGQAVWVGVAADLLVIVAGTMFGLYMLRVLRQGSKREEDLTRALGRLSDRDELLHRLRSTSAVLGEVSVELRGAARSAAAATQEQSAAVAQTSDTVEQLATTATSIADNVHAVADAAQRTGDTMRDVQDVVDSIAAGAQSLGQRAQKTGGILALINDIAQQTNLLALNAAVEAARAGAAGKGFAVVATEVRKLAARSLRSTDSISEFIAGVQDETSTAIMATERGTRQAREVGELMASTAGLIAQSILATRQQKSAADQVETAFQQIRNAASKLATEQTHWSATSERLEALVKSLETALFDGDRHDGDRRPVAARLSSGGSAFPPERRETLP